MNEINVSQTIAYSSMEIAVDLTCQLKAAVWERWPGTAR